jgi:formylglycine-generating enzyme required for sulfatase activity
METMKSRIKFLFTTIPGLILVNAAIIAVVVAVFGTLSGPMKEWGIAAITEKLLAMDMQPGDREGRIIMLYHTIAIAFVALVTYLILAVVKFREQQAANIRNIITVGYLMVVIFGLGFAYWGHNWAFHGLFLAGQALVFYAGVLLTIALWPWNRAYYNTEAHYAHSRKGMPLERAAFFTMAAAMLGSAIFGAVTGSYWGNGHETFLAENGVRHVHHTALQLAIIGHLHIMLSLIGIAVTLIIGRWFDWRGITHKIGIRLFIIGTIVLTLGVWLVVPYQLYAHTIIYVGAVFAMSGALMLVIFGWGQLIREGIEGKEKAGFFTRIGALIKDPLRFGALWQMVFMNFTVSGVGIFMAIKLEEIFRTIPFREERITLTGHWHILAALTGTIVLFYLMSEVFPIKGKLRQWLGWTIIIGSDVAFAMITLFSLKRLWVSEENQQPLVDFYMIMADISLGLVEVMLAIYMVWLLFKLLNKKIFKLGGLAALLMVLISCGEPATDVDPGSVGLNLTIVPGNWVTVPAGVFISGLNSHAIDIDYEYEIMTTEVTWQQYAVYLTEALTAGEVSVIDGMVRGHYPGDAFHEGRHEHEFPEGDYDYCALNGQKSRLLLNDNVVTVVPGYELFPAAYVSWMGAWAFTQHYGWRLPGHLEWEKAARGTDGRAFPFDEEPSPESANYHHSHDPFDAANGTTPIGFYNGNKHGDFQTIDSPSPYGCYDMAGNVAEWMGDVLHGSHQRLIYGGSMMEYAYDLRCWTENSGIPEYTSFQVGFRAARTPTIPVTMEVDETEAEPTVTH